MKYNWELNKISWAMNEHLWVFLFPAAETKGLEYINAHLVVK